jgi:hypothetical protein
MIAPQINRLILVGCLVLASCDESAPANLADAPQTVQERPKTSTMIRTMAGEPDQEAFLVEPAQGIPPADKMAGAVREMGYPCEEMTAFNQLEQNGKVMDVYKLDCLARSYQITMVDGNAHVKPWTGNIFGR